MKKFLYAFLLCLFVSAAAPFVLAHFEANATCPVMHGERVKEKFFVDYQGERIFLCCRNCVIAFRKKPEKYMKRLRQAEAEAQTKKSL